MRHPFLRTLAGSAATPTDPNFENVTLLLHGDGTNGGQNNTFVDGSTNNFTITRNGNTTQGTFSPYGDNWSNYFDGTNDYFSLADNAALEPGSSDLTWEAWINTTLDRKDAMLYARGTSYGAGVWLFLINSASSTAGDVALWLGDYSASVPLLVTSGVSVRDGAWHHLALVRNGSSWAIYIDGVSRATATWSGTISDIAVGATIARDALVPTTRDYQGYISNLRIIKGTAVYTSNFTPPTAPLTAITNTSLLTCQSNRFRDASTNNFTLTRNGDVSVQRFSPFSPTAAYAAGTIGGSGYFDGTGDYLTAPDNAALDFGTGDFTIECWAYIAGNSALNSSSVRDAGLFSTNPTTVPGTLTDLYQFGIAGNGTTTGTGLFFQSWQAGSFYTVSATVTLTQKAWHHIAVARSGTATKLFLNGSEVASGTFGNQTINTIYPAAIGRNGYPGYLNELNGYISNLRVLKGTAQYTGTYTVPTAPLTAITNTSLLLNFTNAAILDNAMMAVPETVGNAQIDTTTKKFGTGSLEFDGTGDYLRSRNNPDLAFGTGNFTIEAWVYIAGNSSADAGGNREAAVLSSLGGGTLTGYEFKIRGNTTTTGTGLEFTTFVSGTSYTISSTSTLSQSTWHHIAVVRSGTTTTLYLNGTSIGSGTLGNQTINPIYDLWVGGNDLASYPHFLNGYIDDLRITKGVARYTANFTAPTAAFPDL